MAKKTAQKKTRMLPDGVREVTRHVKTSVQTMLWGRAAGRCEFQGCNRVLSRSPVTQETVNIAEKAHIYSFSDGGSRGNEGVSDEELNTVENLILVCHTCHKKIDKTVDGGRYTAPLLKEMKASHERRVEIVTGIDPGRRSHVLLYGANVGEHTAPSLFNEAAGAMFPDRYPAEARPVALGIIDSSGQDKSADFWKSQSTELITQFNRRVRDRVSQREIDHLSVFAIAPQPLLILLGTLLGDIVPADVFQRHREPQTWSWPTSATPLEFQVQKPASTTGTPALVIGTTATVTQDRIEKVLDAGVSIWSVTIARPNNDHVKSREDLSRFRSLLRILFDDIKAAHGQWTLLHVFPATAVSLAVEFGRARMPKADMPWRIYDQNNDLGGFIPALDIPLETDRCTQCLKTRNAC